MQSGRLSRSFLPSLVLLLCGLASAPAFAADATGCHDPDWAQPRLAGFEISDCPEKAWTTLSIGLPKGAVVIAGRRSTTDYGQISGSPDVGARDVEAHYIALAQKAGATLVSSPGDGYKAVLTKKSAAGEFWYIYAHGSGNETSTGSFTLTTFQILPLKQEVQAQAVTAALDVTSKSCSNPPWLARQFDYFRIEDCEKKVYDTAEVSIVGGHKALAGKRLTVNYTLTDDKRDPAAVAVQRNFIAALQAAGGKLMSNPDDANRAIFMMKAAKAELWIIYEHSSGNEDSTGGYRLTTFELAAFDQVVQAQPLKAAFETPAKPCAPPPWLVQQFDYFKLSECNNRDFDSVTLRLANGDKIVAGRVLETRFVLTDNALSPTAAYVRTNYINALQGIGAKLMSRSDDGYNAVLMQATPFGQVWYAYDHSSGNSDSTGSYTLITVLVGAPPPKVCKMAVYGINFDFDKATLRPESGAVLEQLAAMFKADPAYAGEIGGHTDNVGKPDYNMKLSGARADAVKAWLVGHGIAATRLTTHGYGDTVPLVPNTSDANRFRNRRVELKRLNCKS